MIEAAHVRPNRPLANRSSVLDAPYATPELNRVIYAFGCRYGWHTTIFDALWPRFTLRHKAT